MMKIIAKIIVLLLSITSYTSTFDTAMKVFLQKCTSKCNDSYCNITSVCRPVNRTSKLVSVDLYFHRGVNLEAPINVEVNAFKKFTTVYRPFMITIKEELCTQLVQRNHILFQLDGNTKPLGNMIDPCPLRGHRYTIPRVTNEDTFIFPLIPVGEWRVDIVFLKNKNESDELIASLSMFYEIRPTGAKEF